MRLYFALNGALHDAAIAAWRAKREYQAVRPISMVRSLAFAGQSSDPQAASYSPDGLPLRPGSRRAVTRASSARGAATRRSPRTSGTSLSAPTVGWVLGTRLDAGRGHASVSGLGLGRERVRRAAAVVLRNASGAPYGGAAAAGLAGVRAGTETAADAAAGRRLGSVVGRDAWKRAERYVAGAG